MLYYESEEKKGENMSTETMLKPINITSAKGVENFVNSLEYAEKHPLKLKNINSYNFKSRNDLQKAIKKIVEVNLNE